MVPGRDKKFSLLRSHPYRLLFNAYRSSVQGIKRSGCAVDRSLSSSAQVETQWSFTSAPLVWPRDVERGAYIKQSDTIAGMRAECVRRVGIFLAYEEMDILLGLMSP